MTAEAPVSPGGNVTHGAVGKAERRVPVALEAADNGIIKDLRIGCGSRIKTVKRLLQMRKVGHGCIIPHPAIIDPQKCAAFDAGLHFLQNTVCIGNHGPAAVLGADVSIKTVFEFNHKRKPPSL